MLLFFKIKCTYTAGWSILLKKLRPCKRVFDMSNPGDGWWAPCDVHTIGVVIIPKKTTKFCEVCGIDNVPIKT